MEDNQADTFLVALQNSSVECFSLEDAIAVKTANAITATGKINGIKTRVDFDVFSGDTVLFNSLLIK